MPPSHTRSVQRQIIQHEALSWLAAHPTPPQSSIITSLPDVSELPGRDLSAWKEWFGHAVGCLLRWLPESGVAIFFQSDIRQNNVWIDKGYLVMRAAEEVGATLLWHRIACRKPAGTTSYGRATYSHLLCFARSALPVPARAFPDVLPDAGFQPWSRAMGVNACRLACEFVRAATDSQLIVDPFCGHGTVLAVANALGFDALGIDLSARQCRAAKRLSVEL